MGARGKIRRRSNGELARGKLAPNFPKVPPLMVEFDETPVDPISPTDLAHAVTLRNEHVPIDLNAIHELEEQEGVDGMDRREQLSEVSIKDRLGTEIGEAASWRAYMLCQFLTRKGTQYHEVRADGAVEVDAGLLTYGASTPMTMHPDEALMWPPTT